MARPSRQQIEKEVNDQFDRLIAAEDLARRRFKLLLKEIGRIRDGKRTDVGRDEMKLVRKTLIGTRRMNVVLRHKHDVMSDVMAHLDKERDSPKLLATLKKASEAEEGVAALLGLCIDRLGIGQKKLK